MGNRGYSAMTLKRIPFSRTAVRTFRSKDAHKFVCNRCVLPFQPGEKGKQTSFGAYKHVKCPKGDGQ